MEKLFIVRTSVSSFQNYEGKFEQLVKEHGDVIVINYDFVKVN